MFDTFLADLVKAAVAAPFSILTGYLLARLVRSAQTPATANALVQQDPPNEVFSHPIALLLPMAIFLLLWIIGAADQEVVKRFRVLILATTLVIYAYSMLRHVVLLNKGVGAPSRLLSNILLCTVCLLPLLILIFF